MLFYFGGKDVTARGILETVLYVCDIERAGIFYCSTSHFSCAFFFLKMDLPATVQIRTTACRGKLNPVI